MANKTVKHYSSLVSNGTEGDGTMKRNAQPTPNPVTGQAPKILTVKQVADLLQIPNSSVYEKTRARRGAAPPLPCRRVGKYLRFFEGEVMAWLIALPLNNLLQKKRRTTVLLR
jgi:predicted DNA-binding transcriptional regulator AlpA